MALQFRGLVIAAALSVPGSAFAASVAVPPLVAKGVETKVANNATSILSMELDFSGAFDQVIEIPSAPSTLNATCLTSTSCLGGIAKTAGSDQLVAGTITTGPEGYAISLVLYDKAKNTIVRKKTFDVPTDASAMSKSGSKMVREILGQAGKAEEKDETAAAAASFSDADAEDDFEFEAAPPPAKTSSTKTSGTKTSAATKPTNTKVTPTVSPQKLEDGGDDEDLMADPEEDDAELRAAEAAKASAAAKAAADAEKKRKAEEAARIAAEEEERRIAEERAAAKAAADAELARRKAEAAKRAAEEAAAEAAAEDARREAELAAAAQADEPSEEDLEAELAAFQFGSSASAIAVEVEEDEPVKTTSSKTSSSTAKTTTTSKPAPKPVVEEEEEEEYVAPPPKTTTKSSSSSSSSSTKSTSKPPPIDDEDEEDLLSDPDEEEDLADLDEDLDEPPVRSSSSNKSSSSNNKSSSSNKSTSTRERPDDDKDSKNSLTLYPRLGVARYGNDFTFLTFGGELGIPFASKARVVIGVEGYATQRHYDEEAAEIIADKEGIDVDDVDLDPWNTILPINLGVQYYGGSDQVKGYGGLDLVGGAITAEIFPPAVGIRARGGVDFIGKSGVGYNLNLGIGALYGEAFPEVQPDVAEADVFWQLSTGLLFAF